MSSYSMFLPSYSIGEDVYEKIGGICESYGKKVIAIGGKTAIEKSRALIEAAASKTNLEILDFIWYGGEASYENGDMLLNNPKVREADMIFAIGGGKAIDTGKYVGDQIKKPIFTFPTIASTCAASSAIGVMYYPTGVMKDVFNPARPAIHCFINTKIIAEAPDVYLWAGIGDTMAKHYEVTFSGRGLELAHSDAFGMAMSTMCAEPLIKYGPKALEDCKKNLCTYEIEQVALCILITTGLVSNMVDININSNVAHSIFYGMTNLKQIEERHLHGEVVSYGVLVLLTMDKQYDERNKLYKVYKEMHLPTKLSDIEVTVDELDPVFDKLLSTYDIEVAPYKITKELVLNAMIELEKYNGEN